MDIDIMEGSSSSFGRPNPFLIPLIIQKVFKDLSLRDLNNCRRVCQLWKICSLTEVRKKRVIKILTTHQMESYIRLMSGVNPEEFPDANYQLGDIKDPEPQKRVEGVREVRRMTHNAPRQEQIAALAAGLLHRRHNEGILNTGENKLRSQFFTLFGAHVKSLELLKNYQCDSAEIHNILTQTTNLESFAFVHIPCSASEDMAGPTPELELPNLKTLGIRIIPGFDQGDVSHNQFIFIQALLAMVPNLEGLTLGPHCADNSVRFGLRYLEDIIFGVGGVLVASPNSVFKSSALPLIHLKHINLTSPLKDAEVKELTMKGLKLESFNFKFSPDVNGTSVDELLKSFRGDLIKATFDFCSPRTDQSRLSTYLFKTKCEHLQDLTLAGYKGSFRILDNFPGLKSLECCRVPLQESVFPPELRHYNLEELKLSYEPLKCASVTRRIVSSFPNLRTFEFMKGTNECMRAIYWGLPYLEKLAVFNAGCTDEGICGVPQNIYTDIISNKSLTLSYVDPGRIRSDLSIASLQNLKNVRLEGDTITDVSVILGITSCKNLLSLSLKSNQITDESLFNIATSRNMKTLTTLDVSLCSQITEIGKCFVSSELPNIGKSGAVFLSNNRDETKSCVPRSSTEWGAYIPYSNSDTDDDDNVLFDLGEEEVDSD